MVETVSAMTHEMSCESALGELDERPMLFGSFDSPILNTNRPRISSVKNVLDRQCSDECSPSPGRGLAR